MTAQPRFIGYARVSTEDQELTLQRQALRKFGVPSKLIFEEHASGGTMNRPQWNEVMGFVQSGDIIVIWKLDRLGRTLTGVLDTVKQMDKVGVELVSITDAWDTSTAMGDAMFKMALVFAELERRLISERTKAGIAAKRATTDGAWGRRSQIDSSRKRHRKMTRFMQDGTVERLTAREIVPLLNEVDRQAEDISNPETVRRWIRKYRAGEQREFEVAA